VEEINQATARPVAEIDTAGLRRHSVVVEAAERNFSISAVRRSLLDSLLRKVSNHQAVELRRKAFDQLTINGNSAPFLALVGVSLASGTGIITKEDEIESICCEIRHAVSRTGLVPDTDLNSHQWSLKDFKLGKPLAQGCSAVVISARSRNSEEDTFPLAIKMMFNYHAESNALTILRAMQRETVPAKSVHVPDSVTELYSRLSSELVQLPSHPNIVEMVTVFADQVPSLEGDISLYGPALPRRLNPGGLGRNMSLFLVMRRYDLSLAQYLAQHRDISARTSLFLLTQLLEAVSYLSSQGVAHRDLKADNILLSLSGGEQYPSLVITDFGSCLADKKNKLRLSYTSWDTDTGGNAALMAPEVSGATPGTFTSICYEKSDLWSAGTLAYQIYGADNPFYSLDSRRYSVSELPPLPSTSPSVISCLVRAILEPSPARRPRPSLAATVCHLLLWAPSAWCRSSPSSQDILQWLLTMTTKVMCESRWANTGGAQFEYQMVATFLARSDVANIRQSLQWIHNCAES